MKFKKLLQAFLNLFKSKRKREILKRNDIYDDVSGVLGKLLKEKNEKQVALIAEMKSNWREISGQHYGSKFIPGKHTTVNDVFNAINKEYFFKMDALDLYLTKDLQIKCK